MGGRSPAVSRGLAAISCSPTCLGSGRGQGREQKIGPRILPERGWVEALASAGVCGLPAGPSPSPSRAPVRKRNATGQPPAQL